MGDVSNILIICERLEMRFSYRTVLTRHAELNWLVCKSSDAAYYDLYLQLGSDTPSGKTCSNYQTIHLPCLC
jgi:hypothetical protein